jgi:hypothetical protein
MTTPVRGCSVDHMGWLSGLHALVDAVNQAVYEAVVGTATPCLDRLWWACRTRRTIRGCGW